MNFKKLCLSLTSILFVNYNCSMAMPSKEEEACICPLCFDATSSPKIILHDKCLKEVLRTNRIAEDSPLNVLVRSDYVQKDCESTSTKNTKCIICDLAFENTGGYYHLFKSDCCKNLFHVFCVRNWHMNFGECPVCSKKIKIHCGVCGKLLDRSELSDNKKRVVISPCGECFHFDCLIKNVKNENEVSDEELRHDGVTFCPKCEEPISLEYKASELPRRMRKLPRQKLAAEVEAEWQAWEDNYWNNGWRLRQRAEQSMMAAGGPWDDKRQAEWSSQWQAAQQAQWREAYERRNTMLNLLHP